MRRTDENEEIIEIRRMLDIRKIWLTVLTEDGKEVKFECFNVKQLREFISSNVLCY